jgi:phosphatidylglycerophosphatase A
MEKLIVFIATGCYSGMIPKAPGTWGSAFAIIPWYFCRDLPPMAYLTLLVLLLVTGVLSAGSAEKILDRPDPGCIVIDEILGMFIALAFAPEHPAAWLLGFLLFRAFDITKPFPVSWFDTHMHGGLGIMLDDVIAGLYAFASLHIIWIVLERLF